MGLSDDEARKLIRERLREVCGETKTQEKLINLFTEFKITGGVENILEEIKQYVDTKSIAFRCTLGITGSDVRAVISGLLDKRELKKSENSIELMMIRDENSVICKLDSDIKGRIKSLMLNEESGKVKIIARMMPNQSSQGVAEHGKLQIPEEKYQFAILETDKKLEILESIASAKNLDKAIEELYEEGLVEDTAEEKSFGELN